MSTDKPSYTELSAQTQDHDNKFVNVSVKLYKLDADLSVAKDYKAVAGTENSDLEQARLLILLGKLYLRYLDVNPNHIETVIPLSADQEAFRNLSNDAHNVLNSALSKHFRRLARVNTWEAFGLGILVMLIGVFIQFLTANMQI